MQKKTQKKNKNQERLYAACCVMKDLDHTRSIVEQDGADPLGTAHRGISLVHTVTQQQNLDALQLLVSLADLPPADLPAVLDKQNNKGLTLLHICAMAMPRWQAYEPCRAARAVECIDWLVGQGANPNAPSHKGKSPLNVAQHYGCLVIIQAFERHGGVLVLEPRHEDRVPRKWSEARKFCQERRVPVGWKPPKPTLKYPHQPERFPVNARAEP